MDKIREPASSAVDKIGFGDKYRDKPSDTVTVIGDSHVRGIIHHLKRDSNLFGGNSYSGDRIEDIEGRIKNVGDQYTSGSYGWE